MSVRPGSRSLSLILAALLAAGSCSEHEPIVYSDQPAIQSVTPPNNAWNVPITARIQVTFNQDIEPASVTDSSFFIHGVVPGEITCNGRTTTFTPTYSLLYQHTYFVSVTADITTQSGESIKEGFTWQFTTLPQPPQITSFSPSFGYPGTVVTIHGTRFGPNLVKNYVFFSGVRAPLRSADTSTIVAVVPEGAVTGRIRVSSVNGLAISETDFTVIKTGEVWQVLPNIPTEMTLNDVAFNGERYVAVGNQGIALSSVDGVHWTRSYSGTDSRLNAVTWTGERFIAVGTDGKAITSILGSGWSSVPCDTTVVLNDVFGSDPVVAVGEGGVILALNKLQFQRSQNPRGQWLYGGGTLGNFHFAVGDHGTMLCIPANGVFGQWSPVALPTEEHLLDAASSHNLAVVTGYYGTILTSTDAYTWTEQSSGTTDHLGGITYDGVEFITVGTQGTVLRSRDGITWRVSNSGVSSSLNGVAGGTTRWVAVGDSGLIIITPPEPGL